MGQREERDMDAKEAWQAQTGEWPSGSALTANFPSHQPERVTRSSNNHKRTTSPAESDTSRRWAAHHFEWKR